MKKRRKREGGFGIKWKVGIKKGDDGDIWAYVCDGEKTREKKGNVWIKERKRIVNDHLEILLQYFNNIFTINFK